MEKIGLFKNMISLQLKPIYDFSNHDKKRTYKIEHGNSTFTYTMLPPMLPPMTGVELLR